MLDWQGVEKTSKWRAELCQVFVNGLNHSYLGRGQIHEKRELRKRTLALNLNMGSNSDASKLQFL